MSSVTSANQKSWILLLYIAIIEVVFYLTISPEKTSREIYIEHKELLEYPCCVPFETGSPQSNIVFLNTTATRSFIVFGILSRFSLSDTLDVFIQEAPYNSTLRALSGTESIDDKYNVLFLFGKFTPEIYNYTHPNTRTVTILRNPINTFESYYNEYRNNNSFGSFNDFVSKVTANQQGLELNPLSTQLGLAKEHQNNDTEIRKFIKELERTFDLVMISEHMETSLVLLANLMRWPLPYVTNLPYGNITAPKYNFTDVEKIDIQQMNFADAMLYDYFLNKFENCALQYGVHQLLNEMKMLSLYDEDVRRYCSSPNKPVEESKGNFRSCDAYFATEEQLIKQITEEQIARTQKQRIMEYIIIH